MYCFKKEELPKILNWFSIFFIISVYFVEIHSEEKHYAMSITRMLELFDTENILIGATLKHLTELKEKLDKVKSIIRHLREIHDKVGSNAEEYVSNPLHSFPLIRRMHADWSKWIDFIKSPMKNINSSLRREKMAFPSTLDVAEAAKGLQRIQSYYQINPIYLAEGISDKAGSSGGTLTCMDLQQIGNALLEANLSADAVLWFEAAIQKCLQRTKTEVKLNKEIYNFSSWHLYINYTIALLRHDQAQKALTAVEHGIPIMPFHKEIWHLKAEIEKIIATSQNFYYEPEPANNAFAHFCRTDFLKKSQNFYCHLETSSHAFYRLSPLKLEILSVDPYVAIYHDAMFESEMLDLKRKTYADMQLHAHPDTLLTLNQTTKIFQHISDLTGFNAEGFEELSVANYGIGSHAKLHYDFYLPRINEHQNSLENRMATAILYLSDVEQGGGTIFPWQNLYINPRKGSILLWYNLEKNGNPDWRTLHGACPIIFGSKWVGTIWIQYTHQMFTKPCLRK